MSAYEREREIMKHRTAETHTRKKQHHAESFLKNFVLFFPSALPLDVPAQSFEGLMWEVVEGGAGGGTWKEREREREWKRDEGGVHVLPLPFSLSSLFPQCLTSLVAFVHRIVCELRRREVKRGRGSRRQRKRQRMRLRRPWV